jgi:hypothetical protein
MQVNFNSSVNQANFNFKARFSSKHIEIFMDSALKDAEAKQNSVMKFVHRNTGVMPEKCPLNESTIYGKYTLAKKNFRSFIIKERRIKMKVNLNVNSNSNFNQIRPQFKALKGISYEHGFNPNTFVEDARTVKAFFKNNAIMNFCKKFDVIAELKHVHAQGVLNSLLLRIPKDEKFDINDDGRLLNLVFLHEDENLTFESFINNISKRDIEVEKDRVLGNIRKEEHLEKEHGNLLSEIGDLFKKHIK